MAGVSSSVLGGVTGVGVEITAALMGFNKSMSWKRHSLEHLVGEAVEVLSSAPRAAGVGIGVEDDDEDVSDTLKAIGDECSSGTSVVEQLSMVPRLLSGVAAHSRYNPLLISIRQQSS